MHFHIEVITDEIPDEVDIDQLLYEVTAFDWWQIGGRWKGVHAKGYDREKDPENLDENNRTKHPTDWPRHDLDTIPVKDIPEDLSAYAVLRDRSAYYTDEEPGWNPCGAFEVRYEDGLTAKEILAKYNITDGYVTTVDCHW